MIHYKIFFLKATLNLYVIMTAKKGTAPFHIAIYTRLPEAVPQPLLLISLSNFSLLLCCVVYSSKKVKPFRCGGGCGDTVLLCQCLFCLTHCCDITVVVLNKKNLNLPGVVVVWFFTDYNSTLRLHWVT